jgi:hypothetical protein
MHSQETELWHLPHQLRSLVESELSSGERVIWIGKPNPSRMALRTVPIVLFGIPWTVFALFWTWGASGFQLPNFNEGFNLFPMFGIPFVLVGLGMLSSPFWVMRSAKMTVYVLTNSRAIICENGISTTIRSFSPERLGDLQRKQRADGSGDLIFGRELTRYANGKSRLTEHGFLAIADVKAVEDMVRQLAGTFAMPASF